MKKESRRKKQEARRKNKEAETQEEISKRPHQASHKHTPTHIGRPSNEINPLKKAKSPSSCLNLT